MPGIPYGCRVLINLALAAESIGGASAPSRLVVVLHLNERQVEQVWIMPSAPPSLLWLMPLTNVARPSHHENSNHCHDPVPHRLMQALQQLASFNFCGLRPGNVWIVVQRRRPAYHHDPKAPSQQLFVPSSSGSISHDGDPGGGASPKLRGVGSGLAMQQLCWVGEGMAMDARDGALKPLENSIIDGLEARGVKWLVTRQACDTCLMSKEGCFDNVQLPFMLAAHKMGFAQSSTQARDPHSA